MTCMWNCQQRKVIDAMKGCGTLIRARVDGRALHASPLPRKRERGCLKAQYRGSRRRR